jgi:hypothetical protein
MHVQHRVAAIATGARTITVRITDSPLVLFGCPDFFGYQRSALESGLSALN